MSYEHTEVFQFGICKSSPRVDSTAFKAGYDKGTSDVQSPQQLGPPRSLHEITPQI